MLSTDLKGIVGRGHGFVWRRKIKGYNIEVVCHAGMYWKVHNKALEFLKTLCYNIVKDPAPRRPLSRTGKGNV